MILKRITVANFRRFKYANIDFAPGLNVIKGPNESGKSTLIQAILAALYWKPVSARKEMLSCASWNSQDGFQLELEGLSDTGEAWTLKKDFQAKSVSLEGPLGTVKDIKRIEDWVGLQTGLPTERSFRSTAGIRQDEIAMLSEGVEDLKRNLQAVITGGAEGVSSIDVISSMAKARGELLKGTTRDARNPGPLASLTRKLQEVENERKRIEEKLESVLQAERKAEELERELEATEEEISALVKIEENFTENVRLKEEIKELMERYGQLAEISQLWAEREAALREKEERYGRLEQVISDKGEWLSGMEMRIAGLREGVRRLEGELTGTPVKPSKSEKVHTIIIVGGLGLLLLFMILGVFLKTYFVFAAIAVILFMLLYATQTSLSRPQEKATYTIPLAKRLEEMRGDLARLTRQVEEAVAPAGCSGIKDFNESKLLYLELVGKIRDIESKIEALSRGKSKEEVESEMRSLATEIDVRERRYRDLDKNLDSLLEFEKAQLKEEKMRKKREDLKSEILRLELIVKEREPYEEYLVSLEEEESHLLEQLAILRRRSDAFALAIEWLRQAQEKVMVGIKDQAEKMAGKMLSDITGGRYNQVHISPDNFEPEVFSREKGEFTQIGELSRGTIDQVYLSIRLALMKIICGKSKPPLILDDPFFTFDSQRLSKSLQLLKQISREYQVLLFTCSDSYDQYADHIIRLVPAS